MVALNTAHPETTGAVVQERDAKIVHKGEHGILAVA